MTHSVAAKLNTGMTLGFDVLCERSIVKRSDGRNSMAMDHVGKACFELWMAVQQAIHHRAGQIKQRTLVVIWQPLEAIESFVHLCFEGAQSKILSRLRNGLGAWSKMDLNVLYIT
ncbi:hypothetical protein ABK16_12540 [Vibrio parahaemolyticus]|nr:hypothetical protein ABK16_12540 [Vibrio parahaemolyticus]